MGVIRRSLIKISAFFLQGTVHLVGRNMQELMVFRISPVFFFPCSLCGIQHGQSAEYICFYENIRIFNASVDMAFRGEMNDSVDVIILKQGLYRLRIADICLNELIIAFVFDVF